jgi:hypothetical protein
MDGGVPQLNATKTQESLNNKKNRRESVVKFAKNTSGVAQPCDTGNGHVRMGNWTKRMSQDKNKTYYTPSTGVIVVVGKKLQELRDKGDLLIAATKYDCICWIAAIYNSITYKSFDRKSIVQSFQIPGWVCNKQIGVDLEAVYNTFKGLRTIEMREKWDQDLPRLIKDVLEHGRVLESTFDELEYPVDTDSNGKEYPLSTALYTQHSRQRCTVMTHDKNCEGFRLAEEGNIESRESAEVAIANEQNWRSYILEKNAIVEQLVQDNLESVDGVDSFTGLIGEYTTEDYVPDEIIKLFEKRGVPTDAFVRARCTTSQHDSSFKAPKNKGKAEKVIEYLQKKRDNPHIELTPEYDCWVLRAAECCRKPVILSETVEASEERTSSDAETEADEQPIAISNPIDIVGNSPLLLEASRCFVGCTMQTEVDAVVRKQIDVAMAKVKSRYEFFKNHDIPNTTELQYHWALGAFEENIR